MVTTNCFMASIDIKDAYYSVPIAPEHRKYLRFQWKGKLLQYTCFPNGLACCPRLFTKLLKLAYASLRQTGDEIVPYIDDSYLQGGTEQECWQSVKKTALLLQDLGFIIHPDNLVFIAIKPGYFLLICLSRFHTYLWFWFFVKVKCRYTHTGWVVIKEIYCCIDISSLYLSWLQNLTWSLKQMT